MQARDLPSVLGSANDSAVRTCLLLDETAPSPRSNQERLGNKGKERRSEWASQSHGNGFRNKADRGFQGFSSGTSFLGTAVLDRRCSFDEEETGTEKEGHRGEAISETNEN